MSKWAERCKCGHMMMDHGIVGCVKCSCEKYEKDKNGEKEDGV